MVRMTAIQMTACVISAGIGKSAIRSITIVIWKTVFTLPHMLAAITTPASDAIKRKPLMINSRAMMIMTTQAAKRCWLERQIKAEQTNSLSASGSINLPKFVTKPRARAILPSKRSVRLARQKIASAIHFFWRL